MSKHRAPVRPRYGRLAVLGASVSVTAIAVLAAVVGLPAQGGSGGVAGAATANRVGGVSAVEAPIETPIARVQRSAPVERKVEPARDTTLPAQSGSGYRVVFSESRQRVWLVEADETVRRTYLVSGSVYDNLDPGTYSVYSRSEQAWGIDDSGTMRYFVRFARGERAAIGFHDIPIADGAPVQTVAQLGTPLSHGCIRQRPADAKALWDFAPLGTTVVVTP